MNITGNMCSTGNFQCCVIAGQLISIRQIYSRGILISRIFNRCTAQGDFTVLTDLNMPVAENTVQCCKVTSIMYCQRTADKAPGAVSRTSGEVMLTALS